MRYEVYSLRSKLYTNYTLNYTEPYTEHRKEPTQKPYTEPCTATRWQARLSSLEGCTVSNRGQRPRTAATPQCQPGRLYAREDGGGSRTTFAANGLKAQRAHSPGQVSVANDTPGHV